MRATAPTAVVPPPRPHLPNATTTITLAKSGSDITFAWTVAAGQSYAGTRATNKAFYNALTMFTGVTVGTYTYAGGLTNGRGTEFFDITDTTETNAGTVNNGGALPPTPPTINAPPSGTFYIGLTGAQLTGSNFSTVAPDNVVWFPGGVRAQATTATSTQLNFDIPPGALSGYITSSVQSDLVSNGVKADVYLENPVGNGLTTIRSLGLAPAAGDYWFAGTASTVSGLFRYAYDGAGTKKWVRTDQSGTNHELMNCSTKTDRFGRIFCAMTVISTSGTANSRMAQTNPAGTLQICRVLGLGILSSAGDSVRLLGAAADPNPDAVAGRDMVYFAFQNVTRTPTQNFIVQVPVDATGCGIPTTAQQNYGGVGGAGLTLQTIVGMAVDRDGSLYFTDGATVRKIPFGGSATTVKSGFSRLFGLDVNQEAPGSPVHFIGADAPATNPSFVKYWASDNPASPTTVRNTTNQRFAIWGATVMGPTWAFQAAAPQQRIEMLLANDAAAFVLDGAPQLITNISTLDQGVTYISRPVGADVNDKPNNNQVVFRPATVGDTSHSTIKVSAWWSDGVARQVCAVVSDPQSSVGPPVGYEPAPTTPANCGRPWFSASYPCDNKEGFAANGTGSFADGQLKTCSAAACGADDAAPCTFELKITNRYAGDNIQVGFYYPTADPNPKIIRTTAPITAWKHEHIENDSMCRKGGILFRDYGATGQCGGAGQPACCGTAGQPPCNQTTLTTDSVFANGDPIQVFDETKPLGTEATRTVTAKTTNPDGTITLTLDGPLTNTFLASSFDTQTPPQPTFSNMHSGGACSGNTRYAPDLSQLQTAYSDGFVSWHSYRGSTLPYLTQQFFSGFVPNGANLPVYFRLNQIWFSHKQPITCDINGSPCVNCCNQAHNYFNVLGANTLPSDAVTSADADYSFISIQRIEDITIGPAGYCSVYACTGQEMPNYLRRTCTHELGHDFRVNACNALGHDTNNAWCSSSPNNPCVTALANCNNGGPPVLWCQMNDTTAPNFQAVCQRSSGIIRFDCSDLSGLPNCPNIPDCSGPSNLSIRSDNDPE